MRWMKLTRLYRWLPKIGTKALVLRFFSIWFDRDLILVLTLSILKLLFRSLRRGFFRKAVLLLLLVLREENRAVPIELNLMQGLLLEPLLVFMGRTVLGSTCLEGGEGGRSRLDQSFLDEQLYLLVF